jgi:hypothetical protein
MPTVEITRSILVNQGLGAHSLELATFAEPASASASAVSDIVGSFKDLVSSGAALKFDPGLIDAILAFKTPLDAATYFINAKFAELGGAAGFLGATTSAVNPTPNGQGFVRNFHNGVIYWHPKTGAHELHGPIKLRWRELGGEGGFLGFPTTDVTPGADVRSDGLFAHFQGGSIYWTPPQQPHAGAVATSVLSNVSAAAVVAAASTAINPAVAATTLATTRAGSFAANAHPTLQVNAQSHGVQAGAAGLAAGGPAIVGERFGAGLEVGAIIGLLESSAGAYEVHGAIRAKYLALGAEASILGYPRTDETGAPDGVGRFNHFQGGSIYWTPGTFAHEVHGLIRDRWASLGWERNAQLGYPITDELIPDLRIGHRRPEVRKKPIVSIPGDVIKLPADAALAAFPASVVNAPLTVSRPALSTTLATRVTATSRPAANTGGALGRLSEKANPVEVISAATAAFQPNLTATIDPNIIGVLLNAPASTAADHRSVNRYADFENGVLFWFRGATSAITLSPLASMADGTDVSFSGADIAAATQARLGKTAFEFANANLLSLTFAGVTGYSFDGAQVHNRRHKLLAVLLGTESQSIPLPFGGSTPGAALPVTATIELQVEIWFDASQRRIALTPVDWVLTQAGSGSYAAAVTSALHARLDPLLWTSFDLVTLPDTDAGAPIAVLSVKTLPNGSVGVFIEPHHNLLLNGVDLVSTTVNPALIVSLPQN